MVLGGLCACGGDYYAPVESRQAPAEHHVKRGDTLHSIAFEYGLSYQEIAAWNGIRSPDLIRVGQVLRLTPARSSKVGAVVESRTRSGLSWDTDAARNRTAGTKKPVGNTARKDDRKSGSMRERRMESLVWSWPTAGRVGKRFSRRSSGKKGIEIRGKAGQAVKSAAAGKVVYAGSGLVGYGKLIIVRHNAVYLSAYGHNSKLLAREGERVRAGRKIAEMGSTGTKSPMLHFEIRKYGKPVNPLRYLPDKK